MDQLSRLVVNARRLIAEGYYRVPDRGTRAPSFLEVLGRSGQPSDVIAEIKFASPTQHSGKARDDFDFILGRIVAAKPLGLSILAEPQIFGGSLDFVRRSAGLGLPVLMKDIVVDGTQIDAAAASGASAVLVIQSLFSRGLLGGDPQELIDVAHDRDLDVVLEVHTHEEWDEAVETDADILGINHRDLGTMEVDLDTSRSILRAKSKDRPVVSMSGIETREQVREMLRVGADAVLVGASIMVHEDPGKKLEELQHG